MLFTLLVPFLIVSSMAQLPGTGPCRYQKIMPNFNVSKLDGTWYGYEAYPTCKTFSRCKTLDVLAKPHFPLLIADSQMAPESPRLVTAIYVGHGVLQLQNEEPALWMIQNTTIWSTDYDSYLIKGGCVNVGPSSLNYVFVLTRSRHPSPAVVEKIDRVLMAEGFPTEYMIKYDQTNCPDEIIRMIRSVMTNYFV